MKLALALLSFGYAAAASCTQFTTLATAEQEISSDTGLPADIPAASTTRVSMNFIKSKGLIEKMHFFSRSKSVESTITKVHIHCGIAGQNGPLLLEAYGATGPLPLIKGRKTEGYIFSENLTGAECNGITVNTLSALKDVIEAHYAYINIHTSEFPGGENRGQIVEEDDNNFHYLTFAVPREEVDSATLDKDNYPNSFTRGDFTFDAGLTRMKIKTVSKQLESAITKVHIHCGPRGVNGDLGLGAYTPGPLEPFGGPLNNRRTVGFLTNADLLAATLNENDRCATDVGFPIVNMASLKKAMDMKLVYLNIHTEAHPGGENRGQIGPC